MDSPQHPDNDAAWERKTLEKLVFAALDEQRARRRWGIAFKALGFIYLLVVLVAVVDWGSGTEQQQRHTAMINLNGVIQARGEANAEDLVAALNSAFEEKHVAGIILRINSPGGSPVQAGIINDEIVRLRGKFPDKPLYAVVEDMCASGGYYVAAAADNIYVNKASIVGSIGVLMDGFGFTGTMEKLGVERRLLTAGVSKGFLDPFSPENETDKAHARQMLGEIHQQFIDVVRKGRGKRLNETPEMFSGLMWSGARSIELGLVDGYGTVDSVARDVIKASEVRDFSIRQNFAEKFAKQFGADMAEGMANVLTRLTLR